ncbi:MAG: RnfABCDGE type electron transport complex subunit B [Panacagrimonas sp.]
MSVSAAELDALLPQTQCTRCGYPACTPYAEAMASGEAEVNRCPPGGAAGIERLARRLNRPVLALDPECGVEKSVETVARVVEADCIGCTKCIQACPVDAILGAMNLMHTVITNECNGCELCLPVCPVDCIVMVEAPSALPAFSRADHFRARYSARNERLARWAREEETQRLARKAALRARDPSPSPPLSLREIQSPARGEGAGA